MHELTKEIRVMLQKYPLNFFLRKLANEIDRRDNNYQTTIVDDLRKMAKIIDRLGK